MSLGIRRKRMEKNWCIRSYFRHQQREKLELGILAEATGMTDVWITSACLGMNSWLKQWLKKLVTFFRSTQKQIRFNGIPTKRGIKLIPQRIFDFIGYTKWVGVYGPIRWKKWFKKNSVTGIMSCESIFHESEKEEDPKGDSCRFDLERAVFAL